MLVSKEEFAVLRKANRKNFGLDIVNPAATELLWNSLEHIGNKANVTFDVFGMDDVELRKVLEGEK